MWIFLLVFLFYTKKKKYKNHDDVTFHGVCTKQRCILTAAPYILDIVLYFSILGYY